jgi:hypothetical protein
VATNRRISEFPEIAGTLIDEPDLLTLVHVFEVDPVLRNKKITFSGFRDYLNKYYIQGSGNLFNGDLVIGENLIVSGTTTLIGNTTANEFQASGLGTFSGIFVQNNLDVTAKISGQTVTGTRALFTYVTGINATFVDSISGQTITGNNIQATNITGANGTFNNSLTGNTVNVTTLTGISGTFVSSLSGETVTGNTAGFTTITGTTVTGTIANFVTISGTTVTGETANFTDITGSTLAITTPSGATAAIVCSGVVSGGASGFIVRGPLVILP